MDQRGGVGAGRDLYVVYDWEAGAPLATEWPEEVWKVDIHPSENRIAYTPNGGICTANVDGSDASCFSPPMEVRIGRLLRERGLTLAVAESCSNNAKIVS